MSMYQSTSGTRTRRAGDEGSLTVINARVPDTFNSTVRLSCHSDSSGMTSFATADCTIYGRDRPAEEEEEETMDTKRHDGMAFASCMCWFTTANSHGWQWGKNSLAGLAVRQRRGRGGPAPPVVSRSLRRHVPTRGGRRRRGDSALVDDPEGGMDDDDGGNADAARRHPVVVGGCRGRGGVVVFAVF